MTKEELKEEIVKLANRCDKSVEQQSVKSVLFGLAGAMSANRERQLMDHAAIFSEYLIKGLTASRN